MKAGGADFAVVWVVLEENGEVLKAASGVFVAKFVEYGFAGVALGFDERQAYDGVETVANAIGAIKRCARNIYVVEYWNALCIVGHEEHVVILFGRVGNRDGAIAFAVHKSTDWALRLGPKR